MGKLKLYTAFHLNLAFSSIPEEQYYIAIDKCYWPLLDILESLDNIKFGLEFTGYTLQKIKEIDYTFIEKLKELYTKGKCEFIGSGLSQAIFPLIPYKVNIKNLEYGNMIYKEILGVTPITGYINEQTFSDGIVSAYIENDYKNLIMDYDNANLFNRYPKDFKYKSHMVSSKNGKLNLLWNNSIAFQKLQRFAFGSISKEEYKDYLLNNFNQSEDRILCLYGGDAEIFDYKPGDYDWLYNHKRKSSDEINRIYDILKDLSSDDRFEFILPSTGAQSFNSNKLITLSKAQYPILCKKQPKYNVVRWAVSGLKNTKMNTECNDIYQKINLLENMKNNTEKFWSNLCILWGSDYRTKTTESKFTEYYSLLGKTYGELNDSLNKQFEVLKKESDYDFYIINTNDYKIPKNYIYKGKIKFEKGKVFENQSKLILDKNEENYQFEELEYYRDGSIRECKLVIEMPEMEKHKKVYGKFIHVEEKRVCKDWITSNGTVETEKVKIKFYDIKKGTIESLVFKELGEDSAIGTIKHGFYDDIRYSPDYFSGHTILRETSLKQITDLDGSSIIYPEENENYNIRIPVKSKIKGEFGELWKIYYIYKNYSRVDIEYNFRLKDINPIFFRTGIITFSPKFFNIDTLYYSTNNGGDEEKYILKGTEMNQSDMISLDISSNGCLGATEEIMCIGDNKKEIVLQRDNTLLYTVPMLEYKEIEGEYFLRLNHSLSESDDTGKIFWRGHSKFKMSIGTEKQRHFNNGIIMIGKDENHA